jgi:phage gpG-like protein
MSKFGFDRVLKNLEQTKKELPKVIANDAKLFFLKSFEQQGWEGVSWKQPQRKIPGTKAYKYPKKGADARHTRAILVQSGALRRAVATSLRTATWQLIRFEVNLPYAAIHNFGLKLGRGTGNMPMRKYMGDSITLRKLQRAKIDRAMGEIWRK